MSLIERAVGDNCPNIKEDVAIIQSSLNKLLILIPKTQKLAIDGRIGAKTIAAIKEFQGNMVNDFSRPSGKVELSSATLKAINVHLKMNHPFNNNQLPPVRKSRTLTQQDYENAANIIGCEVEVINAIERVETKSAFLPSGRPRILFEAHKFSEFTGHIYDNIYKNISSKLWNQELYYGGEKEYKRLVKAMVLDRKEALKSASWGKFQLMGFNHKICGYNDIESFVRDMFWYEEKQLDAFVKFVKATSLEKKMINHNWDRIAFYYNGSGYKRNHYDEKLEMEYNRLKREI